MTTKNKGPLPPPASITLRDVYYVLFRHKWMIAVLATIGIITSFLINSFYPSVYSSEAKILIKYIQETSAPNATESGVHTRSLGDQVNTILNTELEILTSSDLASEVAGSVGPERILGKPQATNNLAVAANFISAHFHADVQRSSDVILLQFSANDPDIVIPVLSDMISAYERRHLAIHMAQSYTETNLTAQVDEAKGHMLEAMKKLENVKESMHIVALDEAKKEVETTMARIKDSMLQTETDMAEAAATLKDLQERRIAGLPLAATTNRSTNVASAAPPPVAPPSPDVIARYQTLNAVLSSRREKEDAVLAEFTTNTAQAQIAEQQRARAEADVKRFETENPGVTGYKATATTSPGAAVAPVVDPNIALRDAEMKGHTLVAKYGQLTNQMAQARAMVLELDAAEDKITQAQTEKDMAESKYRTLQTALDQLRINNETVGNKVPNITTIESPRAPSRDTKTPMKIAEGALAGFLILAFGLPCLFEFVLDRSLKDPLAVQAAIPLPFFINMPKTNGHFKLPALKRSSERPLLTHNGAEPAPAAAEVPTVKPSTNGDVPPWDERHQLRPYFESLRDRVMTYFEMINLTHKPKLLAVTSCDPGAGVSTTAAGLASALSETGEGNVLLVNMNIRDGEAQHFYKGKCECGIEAALEREKRDEAHVVDRLYMARETGNSDTLPRVLPKRFSHLVPMMKASDYDYIIFDMPPVSEISITPRLARFMDMVLLVIESEKTSRDVAARVAAQLAETKTNVGLVMNKNRSYMPKRLEHKI